MRAIDRRNGSGSSATKYTLAAIAGLFTVVIVAASCAVPGQPYRVSPPVMGVIDELTAAPEAIELVLSVMHRENPTLFEIQRTGLEEDGRFYFEPVSLEIAGLEYSKFYRVFLHYRDGQQNQVIWRAEFSRKDLVGRVELDCALGRRPRVSQPCLVRDPLAQPWLVRGGERTFGRLCASCHGEAGQGGRVGRRTIPDLTRIAARRDGRFDRREIAARIEGSDIPPQHGTPMMPAWGERLSAENWRYADPDHLTGATLDPIVVYLESIQRDDSGA